MKTDLFQSYGHCWVFQICWHIERSTFTASSFRIWNNSAGIPSPPLALFIVMFPKAHLILHSRMSGSRWVITPSRLSRSLRSFFCMCMYLFFLVCVFIVMCIFCVFLPPLRLHVILLLDLCLCFGRTYSYLPSWKRLFATKIFENLNVIYVI